MHQNINKIRGSWKCQKTADHDKYLDFLLELCKEAEKPIKDLSIICHDQQDDVYRNILKQIKISSNASRLELNNEIQATMDQICFNDRNLEEASRQLSAKIAGFSSQLASNTAEPSSQLASNIAGSLSQRATNFAGPLSQLASNTARPSSQLASNTAEPSSQLASNIFGSLSQRATNFAGPSSQLASNTARPPSQLASNISGSLSQRATNFAGFSSEVTSYGILTRIDSDFQFTKSNDVEY
ncbi:hypothetical protein ACKWTF_015913 [Chironomus riparius]